MARVELEDLTKVFTEADGGEIVAVDDVTADIEDGEFLVLVGPSGCGKSTTLRMIAGLETVTEGVIRLDGEVINEKKPQDRDIAMVFQSYALYPHMTVRENMSFGLEESTDLPADDIARMVEETAEMLEIGELLKRRPKDLSGGQQQRVALGRAIVRDPEVFLMDEPLSNLDAKLRSEMRTELQRLQEELGTTTVYVTHDQTEAMTMGDRIAILDGGVLQQVATPLEAYHRPANRFVAGFIGEPSMNFFEMRREGDRLVGEDFEYPLSEATREDLGDATEVTLGIRPEDIEVVGGGGSRAGAVADGDGAVEAGGEDGGDEAPADPAGGSAQADHDFRTEVDVVEPMGNENNVYLRFAGGSDDAFVAVVGGMAQVREGEQVVARIPEDAVHIFDAETGEALRNRRLEDAAAAEPRF